MTFRTKFFAAAAVSALMITPVFAQQGTTLAGPAQGSKSNGAASTTPSTSSGASDSTRGAGGSAGVATGTMSGGSTATGGNPGGPAGRN